MWNQIAQQIQAKTAEDFQIVDKRSVSGGCINQAYQLIGKSKQYFVKLNSAVKVEMFAVEAMGLKEMHDTHSIMIPRPICWGVAGNNSYLVLEYYDLGTGSHQDWSLMGKQLALLHKKGRGNRFGWQVNNTIGSTVQVNDWHDNWADFFAEKRIGYQLQLARRNGGHFPDSAAVVDKIKTILADHNPLPALVHGDLWSGNASFTLEGKPIIFDPACYYGDREVDLAMTELFGGFPNAFYQGYQKEYSPDKGYEERKTIYNLYHIINHFNLFGGGYAYQSQNMIKQIMN